MAMCLDVRATCLRVTKQGDGAARYGRDRTAALNRSATSAELGLDPAGRCEAPLSMERGCGPASGTANAVDPQVETTSLVARLLDRQAYDLKAWPE